MRLKVEQIAGLLRDLPSSSSVSITRPGLLARELFTHKGSGTLVRVGESIQRFTEWQSFDLQPLRTLIADSFGRELINNYEQHKPLLTAYISENFRAAAVITENDGLPWLDKFAVTEKAQGEGLGKAVWNAVRDEHKALFWRARRNNPINRFYVNQADGHVKTADWNVYWYGISDFSRIERCVTSAANTPVTFKENAA